VTFLFDTDILSNVLKKNPSLILLRRLATVPADQEFTSAITVGEMVYGAYKSNRPDYFLEKLNRLLWPNLQVVSFDETSARTYGRLRANLEKSGVVLTEPDLRIASIALTHNFTLVTGNTQHFSKVPGLKAENWLV
jgi:predicted nucleic acid-binding protein